ncbi:PREDICTED: putative fatty acyl-CoA reductase CG8306 [Polistes dominula]|uniref:Fatty acyl-CoA reductase n=1 Tax=Polistes dominula TaxID=743375 RepID=A0ABM1IV35_POLDO|nr:PREDICTED: putative fatty acyl-CoA reductase CG8306 [Polistes dominula]XP_015184072.1 PREDICTED: putative fatty acyl-CoA reductase CG8306 [Polistes dominula]
MTLEKKTSVKEFYNGKSIFLTGGTGFLGINLIEKLLRVCPNLENIYLLMRSKKDKQVNDRLDELKRNAIFYRLKKTDKADYLKKLIAVAGDVNEENLGLSEKDRKTITDNVQIVIHSAATLDFEASLKSNININLLGTRRVIQLCHEIKNLKAFIHVSSAYVNSMLSDVDEKIYPAPADVKEVLKMVEELSDKELEEKTPKILGDHPNSYTFSKHLAEHEVANSSLPSAIVRPSMIVGSWKEPEPGWTISKNGPTGFIMGASMGVVRRLPIAKHLIYDYIPVDVVSNTIATAAYAVNRDGGTDVKVYHCTSSTTNPFKWVSIESKITTYLRNFPLMKAVWYPNLKFCNSIFFFKLSAFFIHIIPALLLDTISRFTGKRPMLLRMHRNINNSLGRLEKFIFTEWKFNNPNYMNLSNSLTKEDEEDFYLNIKTLVWDDYFLDLVIGCRKYLSKEPSETIDKARSKQKKLQMIHVTFQVLLFGLIWWLLKVTFNATWIKIGIVLPFIYFLFDMI